MQRCGALATPNPHVRPARSLSRTLFTHGGIYAATRLAERGLGLVLVPLYARALRTDGYGTIALLGSLSPFLSLLFGQGLLAAWFRLRYDYPDEARRRAFESTIVWYLAGSGLLLLLLLSAAGDLLADALGAGVPYFPLVFLTVLSSAMQVYSDLHLRRVLSDQRPLAVVAFSLPRSACVLLGIITGVVLLQLGPLGKVGAEALVTTLFSLVALRVMRPAGPRYASWAILRRGLHYGVPNVPHMLASHINTMASRILISRTLGISATGLYAMGAAIADVGNMVAMSLNQGFSPLFISEMKRIERPDTSAHERTLATHGLARAGILSVATIACVAIGLTASAREVLLLLATDQFGDSYTVVAPLAAGTVLRGAYFVFSQPLFYDRRAIRGMPRVSALGAVINIAINLWLLPRVGFIGSAFGQLAANLVMAVYAAVLGDRVLRLPRLVARWLQLLGYSMLAIAALHGLDTAIDSGGVRIAAKAGVVATAIPLTLAAAGTSPAALLRFLTSRGRR